MRSFRNEDAIRRIQEGSFRGMSELEMKPLYMERCTYDVDLDAPIFRIFQLGYLRSDISGEALTLVKAHPDTWGDFFENPLMMASYRDAETGGAIDLHGVLDFHALCWTKNPTETHQAWEEFSHAQPAIRIETTPRLLLERLMNADDPVFMLRYHIGLVTYEDEASIRRWIGQPDFSVHLDSLGQRLALSAMLLRTCFAHEEEVRLLFSELGNPGSDWARSNITISEGQAKVPFAWPGAIRSATFGSNVSARDQSDFRKMLANCGVTCPINVSSLP